VQLISNIFIHLCFQRRSIDTIKKRGAAAVKRRLPRPALLGLFLILFSRVLIEPPPVIETPYRPAYRRAQAAFFTKNAPFLYSFSLALIFRALADNHAERLFTLAAALPAKPVILPPSVIANKQAPFKTRLFG